MDEPTFRELMNCNLGDDERDWVDPDVEYVDEERTTASLAEVARIVFLED